MDALLRLRKGADGAGLAEDLARAGREVFGRVLPWVYAQGKEALGFASDGLA